MNIYGEYFYGNKISDYGIEHGYVDYGTLAKAFDAVLNNNIISRTDIGYWEIESGMVDNSEEIEELQEKIEELQEKINENESILDEWHTWDDDLINPEIGELAKKLVAENKEIDEIIKELEQDLEELESTDGIIDEVYQWFIVSDGGARILKEANEIVYYNEELDMYLWGVTHFGTSWDYVLTDIPCNTEILS